MAISIKLKQPEPACSHVWRLAAELAKYDEQGEKVTEREQYRVCRSCGCVMRDVLPVSRSGNP